MSGRTAGRAGAAGAGPGRWRAAGLLGLLAAAAAAAPALPPPRDLAQRAGFTQHLGAPLPTQTRFRDSDGQLRDLQALGHGKPLLLALGYYRCPNLCEVVLAGLARSVAKLELVPGRDFEVVFVSVDPRETAADARRSQAMLARMQPAAQVARWHFLTGDAAAVGALARAIGFRYFYDARNQQYAHPAGLAVISPQGTVAQYFFGVSSPPASLRLALVQASRGQLGNLVDQLVLLCCGYDPATGRYSLAVGRVMQALGAGFALALAGWLVWLRRRA